MTDICSRLSDTCTFDTMHMPRQSISPCMWTMCGKIIALGSCSLGDRITFYQCGVCSFSYCQKATCSLQSWCAALCCCRCTTAYNHILHMNKQATLTLPTVICCFSLPDTMGGSPFLYLSCYLISMKQGSLVAYIICCKSGAPIYYSKIMRKWCNYGINLRIWKICTTKRRYCQKSPSMRNFGGLWKAKDIAHGAPGTFTLLQCIQQVKMLLCSEKQSRIICVWVIVVLTALAKLSMSKPNKCSTIWATLIY